MPQRRALPLQVSIFLRRALPWLPEKGFAGRLLANTARTNAERLARRFIAGSNLDEALQNYRECLAVREQYRDG